MSNYVLHVTCNKTKTDLKCNRGNTLHSKTFRIGKWRSVVKFACRIYWYILFQILWYKSPVAVSNQHCNNKYIPLLTSAIRIVQFILPTILCILLILSVSFLQHFSCDLWTYYFHFFRNCFVKCVCIVLLIDPRVTRCFSIFFTLFSISIWATIDTNNGEIQGK